MPSPRLRAFREDRPSLSDEPKFYARILHDIYEDPRINRTARDIFGFLIKSDWTADRVLYITQAALAREARCGVRTVRDSLKRLEQCGYIRREREYRGVRWAIHLCYELRPGLKLEADDTPVTSGSRGASNRQKPAASNRQKPAASNRQKPAAPTLWDEKEKTEMMMAEKPESSSSSSLSLSTPETVEPPPAPKALESPTTLPEPQPVQIPKRDTLEALALARLVEKAALKFPRDADALLPTRVAQAVDYWRCAVDRDEALAVVDATLDYAGRKGYGHKGDGSIGVVFRLLKAWSSQYGLAEIREIAETAGERSRSRTASAAETRAAADGRRAAAAAGAEREAALRAVWERLPAGEREAIEAAVKAENPALARWPKMMEPLFLAALEARLNGRPPTPAHEKPALGPVAKLPPTPAGVNSLPAANPNRNGCTDQEDHRETSHRAVRAGPPGERPNP